MNHWANKLKTVPGPSPLIVLLDLFFILLSIFVVRTNFVHLPGIHSVTLPVLRDAKIISAEKHIITISDDVRENPKGKYVYTFNGEIRDNLVDLENAVRASLAKSSIASKRKQMLVLLAEKTVPYEEVVAMYAFARRLDVQLLLATGFEKQGTANRIVEQ